MPANFSPRSPVNPYVDYPVERLYEFLSSHELRRDVGAEYEYSNLGAGLLSLVLAHRAGTDFETALRDRVFRPLGMTSTVIALTPALKSRMTTAHSSVFRLAPTPIWDFTPAFFGAGSPRSSANVPDVSGGESRLSEDTAIGSNGSYANCSSRRHRQLKMGPGWRIEQTGWNRTAHATYGSRPAASTRSRVLCRGAVKPQQRFTLMTSADMQSEDAVDAGSVVATGERPSPAGRVPGQICRPLPFSDNEIYRRRTRFFIKPASRSSSLQKAFRKGNDDFFSKAADALFTFEFAKDSSKGQTDVCQIYTSCKHTE
jgi:CubicO group peptidase (beta-lactamase class C family)